MDSFLLTDDCRLRKISTVELSHSVYGGRLQNMVGPGKTMGIWGDLGWKEGVALHGQTEVAALEIFQDVWDCSKLSYPSEIIALKDLFHYF